eukprot:11651863-Alexandrium_andersonii.AAC.1
MSPLAQRARGAVPGRGIWVPTCYMGSASALSPEDVLPGHLVHPVHVPTSRAPRRHQPGGRHDFAPSPAALQ